MDNSMKNRNIGWGQWIICCTSVYDVRTTRYCTMYTGRGADYTMNCIEETESFNYYLYYYTVVTQTGRMKWFFGFSFKYSKVRREAAWPSMNGNYCFRAFFFVHGCCCCRFILLSSWVSIDPVIKHACGYVSCAVALWFMEKCCIIHTKSEMGKKELNS